MSLRRLHGITFAWGAKEDFAKASALLWLVAAPNLVLRRRRLSDHGPGNSEVQVEAAPLRVLPRAQTGQTPAAQGNGLERNRDFDGSE